MEAGYASAEGAELQHLHLPEAVLRLRPEFLLKFELHLQPVAVVLRQLSPAPRCLDLQGALRRLGKGQLLYLLVLGRQPDLQHVVLVPQRQQFLAYLLRLLLERLNFAVLLELAAGERLAQVLS